MGFKRVSVLTIVVQFLRKALEFIRVKLKYIVTSKAVQIITESPPKLQVINNI